MFTSLYSFFRIFYDALLDVLFPLSVRASRVRTYTPDTLHASPQTHTAFGMKILTLTRYRECAIKNSIRALKYEKSAHAARLLSGLLTDYLIDTLSELSLFSNKEVILIPMPLFHTRKRARGYNQIQLVLDQLSIQEPAV
jgi:predicted amidophosphoribosyltransferase